MPSATLLASVARYVAEYEQQLGVIIGEEDYTQLVSSPIGQLAPPGAQRRRLRSELALLQLPTDEKRWIGVRDVFEVDGRTVPDRAARITSLLKLPFGTAGDQWRALQEESSRFNIGAIRRTFNVPTFVLLFLRSDNQYRFEFDEPRYEGPDAVVTYREVDRPTFVRDEQGDDEPARGFIRANPLSGAIVATRMVVGLARADVQAQVDVRFAPDSKLRLLVPIEMRERYSAPSGQRVEGVARYRNFKRFEVEATWKPRP